MNAQRQFGINTKNRAKTAEKLSSGYKINRAADDAAGLVISEKMRQLIRGLEKGTNNIEEGISLVQTADGALEEVIENLQRIRELSIAAYNETNSKSDIDAMQAEVDEILAEIDRIGETTTFNSKKILQGSKVSFVGRIPDRIETYIENVRYNREIPDWLWDKSSHSMDFGNDGGNVSTGVDTGVMYSTITDSVTGEKKIVYYGEEIQNPEYGAEWAGQEWTDSLNDNACAKLDFSALADMSSGESLYGALVDLLGVKLAYPCGTCGDARSCVNFVGTVEGLPFIIDKGSSILSASDVDAETADREADVDLSSQKFSYSKADGTTVNEENGYFEAITNLMKEHETNTSLTDAEKATEVKNLAAAIAKNLTTQVSEALTQTSQDHFDRVVRDKNNSDYSMIIFDYRDKAYLTSEQQAVAPVISDVEGYILVPEEKTRKVEGKSLFAPEGIMIVTGVEYENSIEITLPKITLDELNIKGYRLGTEYITNYTYEYGDKAKEKLNEALEQYEKDMEQYEKEKEQYQQKCIEREATAILTPITHPVIIKTSSTAWIDGHMQTIITQTTGYGTSYVKTYTQPEPVKPTEPKKPELSDFNEYATVHETRVAREDTLDPIDKAIDKVLKARSILGAQQNRLEHAYNINKNTHENTQAAESLIRDADICEEILNHSKNNILMQAGQAVLAQANTDMQGVLNLIQ